MTKLKLFFFLENMICVFASAVPGALIITVIPAMVLPAETFGKLFTLFVVFIFVVATKITFLGLVVYAIVPYWLIANNRHSEKKFCIVAIGIAFLYVIMLFFENKHSHFSSIFLPTATFTLGGYATGYFHWILFSRFLAKSSSKIFSVQRRV